MTRYSTLSRIARIAEDQWGLITRRQAEGAGVSQATLQRLAKAGVLDRVAHGVYRLTGAPPPDYLDLRAAWLQLAPEVPAWERTPEQGVVSHRSAAVLYGLGHLPADRHEFTLPERRQSRRSDVRLHHRAVRPDEWIVVHGMPVTRPSRIAADLLDDKEDPEAVAQVIADALRSVHDYPGTFADALAPHAASFGRRRGDGLGLLRWLLDTVGDPEAPQWIQEARVRAENSSGKDGTSPTHPLVKARRR
ncbi:MAG: type IV toxin-antitoxin system AbiEi family antitoxin domain-containing protein [Streptosporangiaceae bacterium]